jgi:serine/threonine protein kinase
MLLILICYSYSYMLLYILLLCGWSYLFQVISKKLLKKKNNTQYMKSERDILTKVEHPFIVALYFAFQVGPPIKPNQTH